MGAQVHDSNFRIAPQPTFHLLCEPASFVFFSPTPGRHRSFFSGQCFPVLTSFRCLFRFFFFFHLWMWSLSVKFCMMRGRSGCAGPGFQYPDRSPTYFESVVRKCFCYLTLYFRFSFLTHPLLHIIGCEFQGIFLHIVGLAPLVCLMFLTSSMRFRIFSDVLHPCLHWGFERRRFASVDVYSRFPSILVDDSRMLVLGLCCHCM